MTTGTLETLHDVRILRCSPGGPVLDGEGAALDPIGDARGRGAELVVVPVVQVADEFFRLRPGVAGAVLQKLVNHRLRLAVVGDTSRRVDAGDALRDFGYESNQGRRLWIVTGHEDLDDRPRR
ncbi:DUF4180 domain-containing protein [Streptomyces sp. NPDC020362]|uniref:DUF4180 domain-containing protein n=1 Tax=unclassified Streptomyces TaxID=2593676 RepID=UPI0033E43891